MELRTAAQMRELDRRAIEEYGVPSLELMENAARAVADTVWELLRPDKSICASSIGVILVHKKDAPPPTEEEKRQEAELREIVESKNTDPTPRVAVFCGPGNNGGDGVACARLLMEKGGCHVRAFFVGDRARMTPDEKAMEEKLLAAGGCLEDFTIDMTDRDTLAGSLTFEQQKITTWISTCDVVVDALFGIGLTRPVTGPFEAAVCLMNGRTVVSCDIPSGTHS